MRARLRIALLAAWSGSLIAYLVLAIGPAFQVLSTPLAAQLLRHGFDGLDRAGMLAGLLCGLLSLGDARRSGRASDWLRTAIPLLAAAGHALSYLWVTPELDAVRQAAGGSVGQLAVGNPGIERFAMLHQLSRWLYSGAVLAALACCIWDIAAPAPRSAHS